MGGGGTLGVRTEDKTDVEVSGSTKKNNNNNNNKLAQTANVAQPLIP